MFFLFKKRLKNVKWKYVKIKNADMFKNYRTHIESTGSSANLYNDIKQSFFLNKLGSHACSPSLLRKKLCLISLYKFAPERSTFYVCGLRENNRASMEVNKEHDPKPRERMCHKKKLFSIEEMSALSIYKSAPELFYN